jgi:hypothetical protein
MGRGTIFTISSIPCSKTTSPFPLNFSYILPFISVTSCRSLRQTAGDAFFQSPKSVSDHVMLGNNREGILARWGREYSKVRWGN